MAAASGRFTGNIGAAARLRRWPSVAYALPHFVIVIFFTPINLIQGIYVKYYGLALGAVAAIVVAARVFDAFADIAIGYLSDASFAVTGSRKPLVGAGAVIASMGGYMLYSPPRHVGIGYLAILTILFYVGWTTFEVSHQAWGGEIAGDAQGKSRIYSYRSAAGFAGLILFYGIPLLPFFGSSEITPATMHVSALLAVALMLPCLAACLLATPGDPEARGTMARRPRLSLAQVLRQLLHNRPLGLFCMASCLQGIAAGMWFGVLFLDADAYLHLGSTFARSNLIGYAVAVASTPLWTALPRRLGTRPSALAALGLVALAYGWTGLLRPGTTTTTFAILLAVQHAGNLGATALLSTMLSDVADYGELRFRQKLTASYFAVISFLAKASLGVGTAVGLAVVNGAGFRFDAPAQTSSAASAMRLVSSVLPLVLATGCAAIFYTIRLDDATGLTVRRALDRRRARLSSGAGAMDGPAPGPMAS